MARLAPLTPKQEVSAPTVRRGRPLDPQTRGFMESRFRHDFGEVRVHADGEAARSAHDLRALAFTRSNHIFFGANQFQPGTTEGQRLLAHELTHVVQQRQAFSPIVQRQADDDAGDAIDDTAISFDDETLADEDGTGVETEESSADESDLGMESASVEEEEPEPVQMKRMNRGAATGTDALEEEADHAANDVVNLRPVSPIRGAPTFAGPQFKKQRAKGPQICDRPSARVADFPATFIGHIEVDLTSPRHDVTLTWAGPNAAGQPTGPFHSSPGAGCCKRNCATDSNVPESDCTPVGTFTVGKHSCHMSKFPEAKNVTWFGRSGIALHFYPSVPDWPASHGCVRLGETASRVIYDNSVAGRTSVTVGGTWTRKKGVCWKCKG
jgi:Domain of unknown function (DUF4157)/L,D-transpeptidase catalytic domain